MYSLRAVFSGSMAPRRKPYKKPSIAHGACRCRWYDIRQVNSSSFKYENQCLSFGFFPFHCLGPTMNNVQRLQSKACAYYPMQRSRMLHYRSIPSNARSVSSSSVEGVIRIPKEEGTISSIFSSLSGEVAEVLPSRFSILKKELWRDDMVQSWKEVLEELEGATEEIANRGPDVCIHLYSKLVQFRDITIR